jgi:hypothetical protein
MTGRRLVVFGEIVAVALLFAGRLSYTSALQSDDRTSINEKAETKEAKIARALSAGPASVNTSKPAMRDQCKTGHGRKPSRTKVLLPLNLL